MARVIWKGAISFGLVHVPVALYPASSESGVDFDWLDKRSMDPVGYKRINKRTGKEIAPEDVVRGIKQDAGDYVVLSDDEIKEAYPKSTQTIEIEAFVNAPEIPFYLLEKPYYLEVLGKGEKVYALLREAMRDLGVIGVARVVMHSKERLAVLVPAGAALMLNTIRWASEIRSADDLKLPPGGRSGVGLKDSELSMAHQLVTDMTRPWQPEAYADRFTEAIHALAAQRVEAGQTAQVTPLEDAEAVTPRSNVIDLTELLKRSLSGARDAPARGKGDAGAAPPRPARKTTAPARKAASPARRGSRRAA